MKNLFQLTFLITSFLILPTTTTFANELKQQTGESDIQFVKRATKLKIHENQTGRTKSLTPGTNTLVAFTERPEPKDPESFEVVMNVFVPNKDETYTASEITACEIEGGSPTLRAFFYAKADKTDQLAIGLICSWTAPHQGADCDLPDQVLFFKYILDSKKIIPVKNENFEKMFYKEVPMEGDSTKTCKARKFENASDIKKILKNSQF